LQKYGLYEKPWTVYDPTQMKTFWESHDKCLPTWNAATIDNTMQVNYIRLE
jgi:hypothetical protein